MTETNEVVETTVETEIRRKRDYVVHRKVCYKICLDCGKIYPISDNSVIHFVNKFGTIPQRCEVCRAANSAAYNEENKSE